MFFKRLSRMESIIAGALLLALAAADITVVSAGNPKMIRPGQPKVDFMQDPGHPVEVALWKLKLDPAARMLANTYRSSITNLQKSGIATGRSPIAARVDDAGQSTVDLFIQLHDPGDTSALKAHGVTIRSVAGDVVVARAPVSVLEALAHEPSVKFVEASRRSKLLMDASRPEIGADKVHAGNNLPHPYRGQGVVVGVLDSGLDFTHEDFRDGSGSRVLWLKEFTQGGGENTWSKAQIDNSPGAVTQRDGNGGGGHGTHVTGTAAGNGRTNSNMTGIAPESDIIFVKGIREPTSNGGFEDADVVAGCQFIFNKAAEAGEPAVINLSLGGHSGPHDGTSLYEQSLSNLTGPGRIIVTAAGNEGFDDIHAGHTSVAGTPNETILLPDQQQQFTLAELWYDPGVVTQVAIAAYILNENQDLVFLGLTDLIQVGDFMDWTAFEVEGQTLGYVAIDAQTTSDPRNGDGTVLCAITNNGDQNIDISQIVWSVASTGQTNGRIDMWVNGAEFWPQLVGLEGVNEMPGNSDMTVGTPATAHGTIAVGSYVTKTIWTDIDGRQLQWQNPDPADPDNSTVVPVIGQRSYFSSKGPTRDGRIIPDVAAPGELIFSAKSSHITEGQGYQRALVMSGDGYLGMQGTSMASPHITGVVALMLQADPSLTQAQARQLLQSTARSDGQTGAVPNNNFGAGRVDALAAVRAAVVTAVEEPASEQLPTSLELAQNYPNPFSARGPETSISFSLPGAAQVKLAVYDVLGREVASLLDERRPASHYAERWDGRDKAGNYVASGVYFYRLEVTPASGKRQVLNRKMAIVR